MLDWAARIDQLAHKLATEYAVDDRPALEILLAALVDCPRTPLTWLVLETDWYQRECLDAWFSFGETWAPCSLSRLRARFPWRDIEAEIAGMLEPPLIERLFVECDYQRYPYFTRLTNAYYLLQRALRLRTHCPRVRDPLGGLDQRQQQRRSDELQAAARYVLEDRIGARPANPPRFVEPANFLYHVELAQKLAPWYPDWELLVKAFASVAVRRAFLLGRSETDASDNQAMARVARDSIPLWIARALKLLVEGPSKTQTLEKHMGLEDKTRRSGHGAHRELVRLHRGGIIRWRSETQSWWLVEAHREGVRAALDGCAFGVERLVSPAWSNAGAALRNSVECRKPVP